MAKPPVLAISRVLNALDRKDRKFYDNLNDKEQKALSPFLMIRYASSIQATGDLQEWYLAATNEYLNKNFFAISPTKHKKLQWLLVTTISPKMGDQYHNWIGMKKKDQTGKTGKLLQELFPSAGDQEIETLQTMYTKDDLKELARDQGWDDKRIKSEL